MLMPQIEGVPPIANLAENLQMGGQTILERTQEKGAKLAAEDWSHLCRRLPKNMRWRTAILLENTKSYFKNFNETVRQQAIGNFDKFAFPLIRAIYPNLVAQELVSVQPMTGPISLIFYLDALYGSNKGSVQAGQAAFDAVSGPNENPSYSSEDVELEPLGAGDDAETNFTGNVGYTPIYQGTVQVAAGDVVGWDDGDGNITGTGIAAGSIDYDTGAYDITFSVAPVGGTIITASYRFDMEGSELVPQMDIGMVSTPVVAQHHKLRIRWSIEAQASARSLHGLDAQSELMAFTAEELKFEIDRRVIRDLYNIALAGHVFWQITQPAGVSFTEHKLSYIDALIELGNLIFRATRRGNMNFIVTSVEVANIIESLPTFVAEPNAFSVQRTAGVVKVGVLNNRWTVYKDPFLGNGQPNPRVFFGGYKGGSWMDAGYVFAPYLPLYTTPTIFLDDFLGRKGLGIAYGKKTINPRFYGTGEVTA